VLESERLAGLHRRVLRDLVAGFEQAGAIDRAVAAAHDWVRADRLNEDARRALNRLMAGAGDGPDALSRHDRTERRLAKGLGVEPVAGTPLLMESSRRQDREATNRED